MAALLHCPALPPHPCLIPLTPSNMGLMPLKRQQPQLQHLLWLLCTLWRRHDTPQSCCHGCNADPGSCCYQTDGCCCWRLRYISTLRLLRCCSCCCSWVVCCCFTLRPGRLPWRAGPGSSSWPHRTWRPWPCAWPPAQQQRPGASSQPAAGQGTQAQTHEGREHTWNATTPARSETAAARICCIHHSQLLQTLSRF